VFLDRATKIWSMLSGDVNHLSLGDPRVLPFSNERYRLHVIMSHYWKTLLIVVDIFLIPLSLFAGADHRGQYSAWNDTFHCSDSSGKSSLSLSLTTRAEPEF
jgi:hypothetical protein